MDMRALIIAAALLSASAAQAVPASRQSVEALLTVTKTQALMEGVYAGMEQMMRESIRQSVEGMPLSAEQQRMLDAVPGKFVGVMRDEMSWERMKPQYVELYTSTFEQDEIDGMLAFYATPAGRAVIDKMPLVMQKSLALSQAMLRSVVPRMKSAVDEAMREARIPGKS
jgi:hypothetical protein